MPFRRQWPHIARLIVPAPLAWYMMCGPRMFVHVMLNLSAKFTGAYEKIPKVTATFFSRERGRPLGSSVAPASSSSSLSMTITSLSFAASPFPLALGIFLFQSANSGILVSAVIDSRFAATP